MIKYLILLSLVSCSQWANDKSDCLNGCNDPDNENKRTPVSEIGPQGVPGKSCTVFETESEIIITCEDGSKSAIVRPKDGSDGENGVNGTSCTVAQHENGATILCQDGTFAEIENGVQGEPGQDGGSCSVTPMENGALISCENGTQVAILNGQDGQNAPPTPYTVTEVINPCGATPGFNEVLLRLADGSLLAHYSHGNRQFLTLIGPGNYVTTQGNPECSFTVGADMSVTDENGNYWGYP